MKNFFVRIQLNSVDGAGASAGTYQSLHEAMENVGAVRTINGEANGAPGIYDLPHGEYRVDSSMQITGVRDAVQTIAERVWADCDVLVIDWDKAAWSLKKHRPVPVLDGPGLRGLLEHNL